MNGVASLRHTGPALRRHLVIRHGVNTLHLTTIRRIMSTDTQAFFVVFADPGDGVPEAEFNDWYENEHIPLRVVIPSFQSWNRWAQADGQKPRYAATYDLDTPNALEKPDYALLARTRSEREKDILSKVGWVDRRVYEVLKGTPQQSPSAQKKPGIIVFNSLEVQSDREEDFHRWYNEEHIPMLLKSPGWIRTRRFVLRTWDRSGVEGSKDSTAPPKFLAVHELESDAAFQSEEYKAAGSTEWRARVMKSAVKQERRVFKFLRTWERD